MRWTTLFCQIVLTGRLGHADEAMINLRLLRMLSRDDGYRLLKSCNDDLPSECRRMTSHPTSCYKKLPEAPAFSASVRKPPSKNDSRLALPFYSNGVRICVDARSGLSLTGVGHSVLVPHVGEVSFVLKPRAGSSSR